MTKIKRTVLLGLMLFTTAVFGKDTDYNDQYVHLSQVTPVTQTYNGVEVTMISFNYGSGIFLQNGKILTASHVLKNDDKVIITLSNGKAVEGKVESRDPEKDYAIVVITSNPSNEKLPKGRPASCVVPEVGENVSWVGHPSGAKFVFSRGYVGKVTPQGLLLDARVIGGMSGSGVLNERGEIIGIVVKAVWDTNYPGSSFGVATPITIVDIICPPK